MFDGQECLSTTEMVIYFNCSQRLLEGALKLHKGQSQDEDKRAGMGTGTG